MSDKEFMLMALEEAKKGCGHTSPNPVVGAVIVKNNKVIGIGHHKKCGSLHAEREAFASLTENAEGAVMYVTLEPCCHYGKTPPCTDAIIEHKISKVFVGCFDPNPLVSKKGVETLRNSGIEVVTDFMKEECLKLNKIFFHYIKTKTPYVVMKYAMTADGKISTATGLSKWITGEKARENVHKSRGIYSAIMVGVETVIKDNPLLTCRIDGYKNPIRIVCDTNLRTPINSNLVNTAGTVRTIIATSKEPSSYSPYLEKGCEVIFVPKENNHIDLKALMSILGEKGIDSILLEGGSTLNFSALESGIVNKIEAYIAPKIFGGKDAKTPVGGTGILNPNDCYKLINPIFSKFEEDFLIEWEVDKCSQE